MSQLLSGDLTSPKLLAMASGLFGAAVAMVPAQAQEYLNGIEWKAPALVTPGKTNDAAPSDAVVLFDGKDFSHWKGAGAWKVEDGAMVAGRGSITSVDEFGDCQVHIEWSAATPPKGNGQGRSNSGCYMQGRYEVQMLDSFGLTGEDNECGGIYEIRKPNVNMCFPPLSWQTYDVEYHAAKFDATGKKTDDAWMSVKHNGVVIHEKVKLPRGTRAAPVAEGPEDGPIYLQDHGDPVRYRNIWIKPLAG